MTKRPYGATAASVVRAFNRNPRASSSQIAAMLGGINPAYVRATLIRSGKRLARSRPYRTASRPLYFSPAPGL